MNEIYYEEGLISGGNEDEVLGIENFRLTDRNKANGDAVFSRRPVSKADFIFYL